MDPVPDEAPAFSEDAAAAKAPLEGVPKPPDVAMKSESNNLDLPPAQEVDEGEVNANAEERVGVKRDCDVVELPRTSLRQSSTCSDAFLIYFAAGETEDAANVAETVAEIGVEAIEVVRAASTCWPSAGRGLTAAMSSTGRGKAEAASPVKEEHEGDTRKPNEGLVNANVEPESTSSGGRRPAMGSADGPEGGVDDSVEELVVEAGIPIKAFAAGILKLLIVEKS